MARQVTIVGPDLSGFSWTCGQCGTNGTEASSEEAMAAFNTHWDSAVIPPVDPWLGQVLNAGQALADAAAGSEDADAWLQALTSVPAVIATAWRDPGNIHPVD